MLTDQTFHPPVVLAVDTSFFKAAPTPLGLNLPRILRLRDIQNRQPSFFKWMVIGFDTSSALRQHLANLGVAIAFFQTFSAQSPEQAITARQYLSTADFVCSNFLKELLTLPNDKCWEYGPDALLTAVEYFTISATPYTKDAFKNIGAKDAAHYGH